MRKSNLFLALALFGLSIGANAQTSTETGIVINGVRWATRNVDKPGTFASAPEKSGMW